MQVNEVIRSIIDSRGLSARGISLALGKADTWARNTMANTRAPRIDTVADVADYAGYDIAIVDRETGAVLGTVDPPRRAAP